MPQIPMPVGDDIFETVRKDGSYYVDKTELITDLVSTKRNKVTLFTRPRRFGKTINMSMLDCFFDITRDSKDLFEGLYISAQKELCENWMNKYPTIFISFKEMSGNTFEYAFSMLKNILSDLCIKFKDIINGKAIDEEDKHFFLRLKSKEATPKPTLTTSSLVHSISMPFTAKKVSITYIPIRLFPSTNACFEISVKPSLAPFSSFV